MEWSGQPFFKLFSNCHMLSGYSSITSFYSPAAGFAVSRVFQHFLPVSERIPSSCVYLCAWRRNTITFISEWMNGKVSHCVCRQRLVFEGARPSRSAPPVHPCMRIFRGWGDSFANDAQAGSWDLTAYFCWPEHDSDTGKITRLPRSLEPNREGSTWPTKK